MHDGLHGVFLHILQHTEGGVQTARLVVQQLNAEIHFDDGEAHIDALLNGAAHVGAGVLAVHVGVAVNAHLVAEFAAQHLPQRDAPRLAGQIPQRDLDAADAAALTGGAAKLTNAAEELIDIAGIFADQTGFEHQRIGCAGSISHLSVADQTLIGVNLDQGAMLGRAGEIGDADIRYFQFGGGGTNVHIF